MRHGGGARSGNHSSCSKLTSPGGQQPRVFLMVPEALGQPALSSASPCEAGGATSALFSQPPASPQGH